jgi:hypothetical protein
MGFPLGTTFNSSLALVCLALAACGAAGYTPWDVAWKDGDTALEAGPFRTREEAEEQAAKACPHRSEVLDTHVERPRSPRAPSVYVTFRCWSQ